MIYYVMCQKSEALTTKETCNMHRKFEIFKKEEEEEMESAALLVQLFIVDVTLEHKKYPSSFSSLQHAQPHYKSPSI